MPPARAPLAAASLAFFASGAAALVYQVAWQRILALHTGVGVYSIAVIVAAFMAGLGVGSYLGGAASERLSPRRALAAFGMLEFAIGAFGAVSVPLYHGALAHAGGLYAHALPAALLHLAALLPPTALMGMSLPFLARATVLDPSRAGRTLGVLYGINMLGAAAGAWLAPWVLVRHAGLTGAVIAAAAANALAGALAVGLVATHREEPPSVATPAVSAPGTEAAGRHPLGLWLVLYAVSGFCALALEVLWFRVLDVATRSTAFTFGTLLALYLLGTAAGCLAAAAFASRLRRPLHFFLVCQCALAAWAGLSIAALPWLPPSTPLLSSLDSFWRSGTLFRLGQGSDVPLLLQLYVVLPLAIFGVPTLLMGVSFPALQRAVQDDPVTTGRKVGRLQAANILGCVAGSLAVGLVGLAWLGTAGSLRAVVLAAGIFALAGLRVYGVRSAFSPLLVLLLATAAAVPSNDRLWPRLLGVTATRGLATEDATSLSAVLPFPDGWKVTVNGKHHSRLPFGGVHTRLGALPAIVHPRPAKVAIVGLGSGDTAWAAGCRAETERLVVFEIAAGQRGLLERVATRVDLPDLRRLLADPRLAVVTADGRHAIARGDERYDLIEADALWPYAAYAGNLYSVEFFRECGERLEAGGLMCTWAPTPRVRASFHAAFPYVVGPGDRWVLIGSRDPIAIDPEAWAARAAGARIAAYLGSERAAEIARAVARLRPLEPDDGTDVRPNLDLFPRDEFLTP
jgi:spermidine synthase